MVEEFFLIQSCHKKLLTVFLTVLQSNDFNSQLSFCDFSHGINYVGLTISAREIYKNIPPASAKIQLAEKWLPAKMPKAIPT